MTDSNPLKECLPLVLLLVVVNVSNYNGHRTVCMYYTLDMTNQNEVMKIIKLLQFAAW